MKTKKTWIILILVTGWGLSPLGISHLFAQDTDGTIQEISTAQAQVYRQNFLAEVKQLVGKPYEYGAVGPEAFDCSGLIYYSASKATGVQLPRTAKAIYNYVKIIPAKDREIGDLLFFKTTSSDTISHIGVYIGNGQFISAISDGPNTGVIVSSLNQDYWKPKYVASGKFLPSGNMFDEDAPSENKYAALTGKSKKSSVKTSNKSTSPQKTSAQKNKKDNSGIPNKSSMKKENGTFQQNVIFDGSLFFDWSLVTPKSFAFKYRGIDMNFNARYAKLDLEPGIGLGFRYNAGLSIFQMPLTVSLTVNDHFRAYAGPVFSFGNAILIDSNKAVKPSVFPGVLGVSFSTNAFDVGKTKLQFTQDVSYTIYNKKDGSALSILESLAAGFVFYTGVKVSLPLSTFVK